MYAMNTEATITTNEIKRNDNTDAQTTPFFISSNMKTHFLTQTCELTTNFISLTRYMINANGLKFNEHTNYQITT